MKGIFNYTPNCSKYFILLHHGLGDVIMTLPLLAGIMKASRDENIKFVIYVASATEFKFVKTVIGDVAGIIVRRFGATVGTMRLKRIVEAIRLFFILNFQKSCLISPCFVDNYLTVRFLSLLPHSHIIGNDGIGLKKQLTVALRKGDTEHKTDYAMRFGEICGLLDRDMIYYLKQNKYCSDFLYKYFNYSISNVPLLDYVVFSPGTWQFEKYKQWPLEKYAELSNILLANYPSLKIVIIVSNLQKKYGEEIIRNVFDRDKVSLKVGLDFPELLSEIKGAKAIVCACSGIGHLASLTDTRIIGLYGPTDHLVTGPYSNSAVIVSAKLPCSPCYPKNNLCKIRNVSANCMKEILVEDVYAYLVKILRCFN
ncbi:MAG: glycosyltransferase family 9 protein [Negativicutes bacterium]